MPDSSARHLGDCTQGSSFYFWWSHNHLVHHVIGKDSSRQLPTSHCTSEAPSVASEVQVATDVLCLFAILLRVGAWNKGGREFLPKFCCYLCCG